MCCHLFSVAWISAAHCFHSVFLHSLFGSPLYLSKCFAQLGIFFPLSLSLTFFHPLEGWGHSSCFMRGEKMFNQIDFSHCPLFIEFCWAQPFNAGPCSRAAEGAIGLWNWDSTNLLPHTTAAFHHLNCPCCCPFVMEPDKTKTKSLHTGMKASFFQSLRKMTIASSLQCSTTSCLWK